MRILWFVDKQFDVSLDRVTWLEMARHLQKSFEIILVTGFKGARPQFKELRREVFYIESPQKKYFKRIGFYKNQIRNFERLLQHFQPTTLFFNTSNPFLLRKAAVARRKYGFQTYLDIRTLPVFPQKVPNFVERILFGYCLRIAARDFDGITYITDNIKNYCQQNFHLPFHKSEIWTSGVDIEIFRPDFSKRKNEIFRIIYHGNLAVNRGLANVIKALKLIENSNVELMLVGSGSGLDHMKKLTSELNLDAKIIFHPAVPYNEVPKLIQEADVGVLPFPNWDGWNTSSPIKLFEYLACGKPVIVTKIPAHLSILEGKEFAFWADASNPESVAKAIIGALNSKRKFEVLGQQARQFVERNYNWEKQAWKLENFLLGKSQIQNV